MWHYCQHSMKSYNRLTRCDSTITPNSHHFSFSVWMQNMKLHHPRNNLKQGYCRQQTSTRAFVLYTTGHQLTAASRMSSLLTPRCAICCRCIRWHSQTVWHRLLNTLEIDYLLQHSTHVDAVALRAVRPIMRKYDIIHKTRSTLCLRKKFPPLNCL